MASSAGGTRSGLTRPGFGSSRRVDPPPGMTIADLADWHATAFRARFGEPVDLIGASGGGVVALQLALDHPQAARRLVLCVAASRIGERARRDLPRMMELEAEGRSSARIGSSLNRPRHPRLAVADVVRPRAFQRDARPAAKASHREVPGRARVGGLDSHTSAIL
ncbi:MAG TPA: alpha/beta fold hydrolase [Trebonia sp.]|nr:alpha/beta fold hydrolase [Trebonia sp.]